MIYPYESCGAPREDFLRLSMQLFFFIELTFRSGLLCII